MKISLLRIEYLNWNAIIFDALQRVAFKVKYSFKNLNLSHLYIYIASLNCELKKRDVDSWKWFFFSRYRSILLEDSFIKDPLDALNSRKYYFVSKSNEWCFIFCLQTFNKRLLRSSFLRMKNQLEKLSEITSLYQSLDTSRFQLFLSYDFNWQ